MSEKKQSYKARQSLQFQAETPNFLRMLQGQVDKTTKNRKIPTFDGSSGDESGPEAPEDDEEKPVIVRMGKGVTKGEVDRYLGREEEKAKEGGPQKRSVEEVVDGEAEPESEPEDESRDGDGKVKFRKPKAKRAGSGPKPTDGKRRKVDERLKEALKGTKKINNKTLLSFGDDE
ncbi:hypothetical protein HKX48_007827 [Thoreauomyces humboldtii]|nr:hypothetical protein HKX48_007827 [Thoreauomyces humboldtii]